MTDRKPPELKVVSGRVGRPTVLDDEMQERVLDGLADGLSLVEICAKPGLPDRRTVQRHIERDADFAARIARARELGADAMDAQVADLIRNVTPESAAADRIKLSALQWRAAKLNPRRYSDKVQAELSGPGGGAVKVEHEMSPIEAARRVAFAMAMAQADIGRQIEGKAQVAEHTEN
jgi:hypothetical protein